MVFSHFVEGDTEDDFFALAQELSDRVKDELEIKVLAQDIAYDLREPLTTTSAEAYRHYVRGEGAYYDGDYQEWVKQHTQAVTIDSLFTEAHLKLAYGYAQTGRPEEARHHAGIAYSQKDRAPYEYQLRLEELREDFAKNPRGRVKWLKQLLALNPNRRWSWWDLGVAYSDLGQYDQAAEAVEKAIELGFQGGSGWKNPWVYWNLGYLYHELGEHDREVEVYEIGLEVLPDHPDLLAGLASEYLFQGDTARAAPYLTRCQQKRAEEGWSPARIVDGLGNIYRDAERWDRAEAHYRRAIALDPDIAEALNNLAYLLIDRDRYVAEGMALAERAQKIRLVSSSSFSYCPLATQGWGYYKQGRYAEAVEVLKRADEQYIWYMPEIHRHLEQARAALAKEK